MIDFFFFTIPDFVLRYKWIIIGGFLVSLGIFSSQISTEVEYATVEEKYFQGRQTGVGIISDGDVMIQTSGPSYELIIKMISTSKAHSLTVNADEYVSAQVGDVISVKVYKIGSLVLTRVYTGD